MPCKRRQQVTPDPRAANGVGFGPQIKSGATNEAVRGLSAALGEIPLFEPGASSAAGAGMTVVRARV